MVVVDAADGLTERFDASVLVGAQAIFLTGRTSHAGSTAAGADTRLLLPAKAKSDFVLEDPQPGWPHALATSGAGDRVGGRRK